MAKGIVPYGEDLADAEDKVRKLREERAALQKRKSIFPSKKRDNLSRLDKKIEKAGYKAMSMKEIVRDNPVSEKSYRKIRDEREIERAERTAKEQRKKEAKERNSLRAKMKNFMKRGKDKDKSISGR